jgi:selenoprotein W-related protein
VRTADQLLDEFERLIERLILIPSSGGRFEIMLDDRLVFSKAKSDRYPEYEELAVVLREVLS